MASVCTETELAIRTENVPDAEGRVLSSVRAWGVNVRALCSYGDGDRIVVLLVAEDTPRANQALTDAGFVCKANPVVVVELENHIGAIAQLGAHLSQAGIEILCSYASFMDDSRIVAVFKTDNDARALEVLQVSRRSNQYAPLSPMGSRAQITR